MAQTVKHTEDKNLASTNALRHQQDRSQVFQGAAAVETQQILLQRRAAMLTEIDSIRTVDRVEAGLLMVVVSLLLISVIGSLSRSTAVSIHSTKKEAVQLTMKSAPLPVATVKSLEAAIDTAIESNEVFSRRVDDALKDLDHTQLGSN